MQSLTPASTTSRHSRKTQPRVCTRWLCTCWPAKLPRSKPCPWCTTSARSNADTHTLCAQLPLRARTHWLHTLTGRLVCHPHSFAIMNRTRCTAAKRRAKGLRAQHNVLKQLRARFASPSHLASAHAPLHTLPVASASLSALAQCFAAHTSRLNAPAQPSSGVLCWRRLLAALGVSSIAPRPLPPLRMPSALVSLLSYNAATMG